MITRQQVASLRPGDVVRLTDGSESPSEVMGMLRSHVGTGLSITPALVIRRSDGEPSSQWEGWFLTVVSRAPRPLYVNHERGEPVLGDVVRDADSTPDKHTWVKNVAGLSHEWLAVPGHVYVPREQLPARLRLLVDGETGQVVR